MTTNSTQTESTVTTPTASKRIRLVLVLGLLTMLGPFTVDMYLPALPAIADDFGAPESSVQLTLTGTLVGLALGQMVIGPLSDFYGRRRPLIVGTAIHVGASGACYFAPNIAALGAFRTLQGIGAAATGVIAMAVVRDLYSGKAAAVMISHLMLVVGVAPIVAPGIGGLLLTTITWHGMFLVLAGLAVVTMTLGVFALPETLPPSKRIRRGLRPALRAYAGPVRDRHFMILVLVCGLVRAVPWAYVAGSPFIMQNQFELEPSVYGLIFAAGGVVLILAARTNIWLLRRWSPERICTGALAASVAVGLTFVGLAPFPALGFAAFIAPALILLFTTGLVTPNTPALALSRHGETAGTAAAIVGFSQFGAGAVIAPIVGTLGNSILAVAATMATCAALSLLVFTLGYRPNRESNATSTPEL